MESKRGSFLFAFLNLHPMRDDTYLNELSRRVVAASLTSADYAGSPETLADAPREKKLS